MPAAINFHFQCVLYLRGCKVQNVFQIVHLSHSKQALSIQYAKSDILSSYMSFPTSLIVLRSKMKVLSLILLVAVSSSQAADRPQFTCQECTHEMHNLGWWVYRGLQEKLKYLQVCENLCWIHHRLPCGGFLPNHWHRWLRSSYWRTLCGNDCKLQNYIEESLLIFLIF